MLTSRSSPQTQIVDRYEPEWQSSQLLPTLVYKYHPKSYPLDLAA